jgi:formate dehydrogenase maturation protein FdhE
MRNDSAANPLLAKYIELVSIQDEMSSMLMETCEVLNATSDFVLLSYFHDETLRPILAKARREAVASGLPAEEASSAASLEELWHQVDEFEYPADFPARLVIEVFATEASLLPHREIETRRDRCPHCGFPVLCAILREAGSGRMRSGCCSLCASEWSVPRLGCLRCGELQSAKLPIFTFEEFPHGRVEACESCEGWLKSIDLAKDTESLPMPDDVWSSAANLWASQQGYKPIGSSLFGL